MSLGAAVLRLELRGLLRSRSTWLLLGAWLAAGALSLALGTSRLALERERAAALGPALHGQDAHLRAAAASGDLGLYFYYLALPSVHEPNAWSALATGLRDTHPTARHLRLLGLVPQLYQAELENPRLRLVGRFDFAFVLVFLLPLAIIGLGYDARSRDEDLGTQPLLAAQPAPLSRLLALRLGARAALVLAASFGLLVVAARWAGLPFDARLATLGAALGGYVAAWFLAVFVLVGMGRSSTFNALSLVGAWLVVCIVLPAALELALARLAPMRGGVELTLAQRQEMNAGWDRPKRATLDPFVSRHPEWADVAVPEQGFSWPWYYAMHEQADVHVAEAVRAYDAALRDRSRSTRLAALALPPLGLQLLLERFASADLAATLAYRASLAAYHEQLKQHVHSAVFSGRSLADFHLDELPRHRFDGSSGVAPALDGAGAGAAPGAAGLVLWSIALTLGARRAARRIDRRLAAT